MDVQQWTFQDRKSWGSGEWDDEPFDKVFFVDEATGLPCLCHRSPMGNWNGYVAVPQSHPLFEVDCSTETPVLSGALAELLESTNAEWTTQRLIEAMSGELSCSPGSVFECHGGLTFSAANKPSSTPRGVWIESDKPLWWFGFDCNHLYDLAPGMTQFSSQMDGTYRNFTYVRNEVVSLAAQVAAVA